MIRRIVRNVTLFGLIWGSAGYLFIDDIADRNSLIVFLALLGTAAGGAAAMATLPQAALAFVAGIGGPVFYKLLTLGEGEFAVVAAFEASMIFVLGAVLAGVYDAVIRSIPQSAAELQPKTRANRSSGARTAKSSSPAE